MFKHQVFLKPFEARVRCQVKFVSNYGQVTFFTMVGMVGDRLALGSKTT